MPVTINGSAGVTTNSGAVYDSLQRGTAVTASGTSVDFTSIPSWVRRITVMLSGVSTNGTSTPTLYLGDSGGFETSSYSGAYSRNHSGVTATAALSTSGFNIIAGGWTASALGSGSVVLTLINSATNTWSCVSVIGSSLGELNFCGGSKSLSDTLTQVRITTVNGTDTFDAGTINIIYE